MKSKLEGTHVVEVIFTNEDLDAWLNKKTYEAKYNEMQKLMNTPVEGITICFDFSYDGNHNICVSRFGLRPDRVSGYVRPGGTSHFSGVKVTNQCRRP